MPKKKKTTQPKRTTQKKKSTTKAVKKAPAKRKTIKKSTKKTCACGKKCPKADAFWINNGPVVRSLEELRNAFNKLSDEQYDHHTKRGDGNDFARWIGDCLSDKDCAQRVKRSKTRVGTLRILNNVCSCA
jgi:hypothetical protein